jgi:hypothetical protein
MGVSRGDVIMELERSEREAGSKQSTHRISRLGLRSLGKFGCVLGALVSWLPSLLTALLGLLLVRGLRRLMESWQGAGFRILGQEISIDVISLLNLAPVLHTVQQLDDLSWTLVILLVVVNSVLAGLIFLLMAFVLGGVYNLIARLTGGLEVELKEVGAQRDSKR